jgi:hypothetical protein
MPRKKIKHCFSFGKCCVEKKSQIFLLDIKNWRGKQLHKSHHTITPTRNDGRASFADFEKAC